MVIISVYYATGTVLPASILNSIVSKTYNTFITAPHISNSLPTNIREAQSILTFRCHLKTTTFSQRFHP